MKLPRLVCLLLLSFGLITPVLAAKRSGPPPQKYCDRTVPPQESPHPYHPSLDDLYLYQGGPVDIPDGPGGVATATIDIPDGTTITDLNVMVTITHTWIRDLRISLIAPNDSEVVLLDLFPGNEIHDMTGTWFDDEADVPIDSGAPPFTGRFRPQDSLTAFDGLNAQGPWTLRVEDQFEADTGRIETWAIEINRIQTLRGQVINAQTQEPLSGVRALVLPDSQASVTDAQGAYGFDLLPGGTHTLQFSKACFDSVIMENIETTDTTQIVIDATLNPSLVQTVDFSSDSTPVNIPDYPAAGAAKAVSVTSSDFICDLDVTVNITHTWVGDLSLWLISPAGDTIQLAFVGDSCYDIGANITACRFDDEADSSYAEAHAPFTGSYRPYHPLGVLDGETTIGPWQLRARDNCAGDIGTIHNFTLHVTTPLTESANGLPYPLPAGFIFEGNYPNPFNSATEFRFSLPRGTFVELVLYDITGRRVATILNGLAPAGEHSVSFDAGGLPSGIYLARLSAAGQSQFHKLILLK